MIVSDLAIVVACVAFLITQVHLAKVARRLVRQSKASWAQAHAEIASAKAEVAAVRADITAELSPLKSKFPDDLQTLSSRLDAIPPELGERMSQQMEETTKKLGDHFSQNLETAVAHLEKQVPAAIEDHLLKARRFAGQPSEAQAKSVESRKVNQVVGVLEEQIMGPTISAKAQELGDFLASVGQTDLADWLAENQDAIGKIERRIRANPALAARLQQFQQSAASGRGGGSGYGGAEL